MSAKRHLVIHLEADESQQLFSFRTAKALREYADLVERGLAGRHACETYSCSNGVTFTAMGTRWSGDELPLPESMFSRDLAAG